MKSVMAACALVLSIAALGASGCRSRGDTDKAFVPSKSCLDLRGDDYARCNNREAVLQENSKRYREAAGSIRGHQPAVPRTCAPNGFGGFECK